MWATRLSADWRSAMCVAGVCARLFEEAPDRPRGVGPLRAHHTHVPQADLGTGERMVDAIRMVVCAARVALLQSPLARYWSVQHLVSSMNKSGVSQGVGCFAYTAHSTAAAAD